MSTHLPTPPGAAVEIPSSDSPPTHQVPDANDRYNRSSLDGDYLVTIEGQTPEDWERRAPEMQFCEYLDGVVYMPSPVSDRHQEITGFVYQLLDGFRWAGRCGQVLTGPAVLRLGWFRKPEPDIFVRPSPHEPRPGFTAQDVKAVFVIEVLSPSNKAHDLERKASIYRDAAIPEIWYVDEEDHLLTVDRRTGDRYTRTAMKSGILASAALPGFWINVEWLWQANLPNPRSCLEEILRGAPQARPDSDPPPLSQGA